MYHRYTGSYRPLFIGLALFHELLKTNRTDDALALASKLAGFYPDDLHAIMLYLEVADIYKNRHDQSKYLQYRDKGLQAARKLNVEVMISLDPRFATPESTWHFFVESLKNGRTDSALECFIPSSAAKYRQIFDALKDKLNEIASDMNDIVKVEQDAQTARFRIIRRENQQEIGYGILFINLFGEWKIQNL